MELLGQNVPIQGLSHDLIKVKNWDFYIYLKRVFRT